MVKRQSIDRAEATVRVVSQRVASLLGTIETAANSNAWLVTDQLRPDSLLALSRRVVLLNANINGCSISTEPGIFPKYGRYFSAYTIRDGDSIITVREAPYEYFDKEWYKTPLNLGEPCWVDPYNDYNKGTLYTKKIIASYCKPIYDVHKQLIGVMTTDLSLPRLAEIIEAEEPYPNSHYVMVGKDGNFFIHPNTDYIGQSVFSDSIAKRQVELIALGHEITTKNSGSQFVKISDQPSMVSYQRIPGTSWSLVLVCPEKVLLHRYNNLTYIIIPLIFIGLLLIAFFCWSIVNKALKPVSKLVIRAQRIAEGHYDEQIPYTTRKDVVGRLQNSFSLMQASLDRHVNEIRQVNADIEKRNAELSKARQLAEEGARQKVAFIQNVTHQVRTPLNIVMGFSQVLHDNFGEMPTEEVRPIAEMMQHNTMALRRMINMLYDSSDTALARQKNNFIYENVSCNEIVRECIMSTQRQYPNIVPISFDSSLPDSFTIYSSRLYLMLSIRELLYNSAKFSDDQHISLRLSAIEDKVRFVIEDKGPGIAEEYHEQMYKPFTKMNSLSEGLGLGLSLVKHHIQMLDGTIIFDTDYKEGCRFIFELPFSIKS